MRQSDCIIDLSFDRTASPCAANVERTARTDLSDCVAAPDARLGGSLAFDKMGMQFSVRARSPEARRLYRNKEAATSQNPTCSTQLQTRLSAPEALLISCSFWEMVSHSILECYRCVIFTSPSEILTTKGQSKHSQANRGHNQSKGVFVFGRSWFLMVTP